MLKHIVLYKLKDSNDRERLVKRFMSIAGKIDELKSVEAGSDSLGSERSLDVALVCEFEDLDSLARYKEHEAHIELSKFVHSIIESSCSVDYYT